MSAPHDRDLRRRLARASALLAVILVWVGTAAGAAAASPPLVIHRSLPPEDEGPLLPEQGKIHPLLRQQARDLAALGVIPETAPAFDLARRFASRLLRVDDAGRVQVYVDVDRVDAPTLALLRQGGLDIEIANADAGIVQGWVAADRLDSLAREAVVRRIRPPDYSVRRIGSKTSEGDAILQANLVRTLLGVTGSGVRVGAISDGVTNLAAAQATGDLPPVTVGNVGSGDEGTALLEIIHDLAPGASLGFSAGLSTSLGFIDSLNFLANVFRAQVIVDDLGFFTEPFFQDGLVAQAVRALLDRGIVYVSSAGNDAISHYQGVYQQFHPLIATHDFGGGDLALGFRVGAGGSAIVLQWGNPFGAATDDYDLCVYADLSGSALIGCSADRQNGFGDPIEAIGLQCLDPSGCTGSLQIKRFSGSPRLLELFVLGGALLEHRVEADSIFGHPAVADVIAVGAIGTDDPGHDTIEFYSSRGDSTILFPPEVRRTPSVAAIDGVTVTGVGGFPSPFFGTSASAPHVAAIAALVLQVNPTLPPAFLRQVLGDTAVDLGPSGFDPTYGFGRVDALAAVSFELAKPSVEIGVNQAAYRAGDRMTVGLVTHPGQGPPLWDLYVVLVLPDQTFLFYRFAPDTSFSLDFQAARPLQAVTEQGTVILDGLVPAGLLAGNYLWAAALITPDLKHAGRIAFAAFTVLP